MMILGLDVATRTGFAYGEAGSKPVSGSVRLKRPDEAQEIAPFNLHCFLRDTFRDLDFLNMMPDLVFAEHYLNPAAQPSADAAIMQLQAHGAMQALCRSYGVRVELAMPSVIRKHFIGIGQAPKGSPKGWIKDQVRRRCVQLGYVDAVCRDLDRTDALAAWDYAAAVFGRKPAPLALYGAR